MLKITNRREDMRKIIFGVVAVIIAVLVIMSAIDDCDPEVGYMIIPHGNHNHYRPCDYDPNADLHAFPTRPPGDGEMITPTGQIIRVDTARTQ